MNNIVSQSRPAPALPRRPAHEGRRAQGLLLAAHQVPRTRPTRTRSARSWPSNVRPPRRRMRTARRIDRRTGAGARRPQRDRARGGASGWRPGRRRDPGGASQRRPGRRDRTAPAPRAPPRSTRVEFDADDTAGHAALLDEASWPSTARSASRSSPSASWATRRGPSAIPHTRSPSSTPTSWRRSACSRCWPTCMRAAGSGQIVVFSSVAGVRVRRANYVYGSAKAGLDGFASGLADALHGTGVQLLLVRPGFVIGRMTEGMSPAPAVEHARPGRRRRGRRLRRATGRACGCPARSARRTSSPGSCPRRSGAACPATLSPRSPCGGRGRRPRRRPGTTRRR